MRSETISVGAKVYTAAGASKDLAQAMTIIYNPLYAVVRLSMLEKSAYREVDFRAVGFLYLFKGDKAKARIYLELAHSMCNELIRENIQKIFDKWEDACAVVDSAREAINQLRTKRKQVPLDKLLD